jgi:hypothetical protein
MGPPNLESRSGEGDGVIVIGPEKLYSCAYIFAKSVSLLRKDGSAILALANAFAQEKEQKTPTVSYDDVPEILKCFPLVTHVAVLFIGHPIRKESNFSSNVQ